MSKEKILEDKFLMLSVETGNNFWKHLSVTKPKECEVFLEAMEEWAAEQLKGEGAGRWVKITEGIFPKEQKPVFGKDAKGKKYVVFYTYGGLIDLELEDYDPNQYPYVTFSGEQYFLNPGFYEELEQSQSFYDYVTFPRDIVEWRDESSPSNKEAIDYTDLLSKAKSFSEGAWIKSEDVVDFFTKLRKHPPRRGSGQLSIQLLMEAEAIAFAEWCYRSGYTYDPSAAAWFHNNGEGIPANELYTLYLTSKANNEK